MTAWEITKKDLRLLFRDRRTLVVLVLFPLIFIAIIGLTTGKLMGWHSENQRIRIAYVDDVAYRELQRVSGRKLLRNPFRQRHMVVRLLNGIQQRDGMEILRAINREEARAMVDGKADERVNVALFIGPSFAEKVNELEVGDVISPSTGRLKDGLKSLDIELHSNEPDSSTHAIIDQLVFANVLSTIAPYVFCSHRTGNLAENARIKQRCSDLHDEAEQDVPAVEPSEEADVGADDRVYREVIPGFTVMFVFFLVNIMAHSFLNERHLGTMKRLRLSPLRPASILSGKTIPFFIVSVLQTVILFVCGRLLFDMSWGSHPWLLLPVIVSTSLAATGLGLLVATIVRTDSQVSAYANIMVISMAGISGCFMPRDWLSERVQQISKVTPHAWALDAYNNILTANQPDAMIVFQCSGVLILFAAFFFAIGCVRFGYVD